MQVVVFKCFVKVVLSDATLVSFKFYSATEFLAVPSTILQVIMQSLGHNPTDEEIAKMIEEVDVDGKPHTLVCSCTRVFHAPWLFRVGLYT